MATEVIVTADFEAWWDCLGIEEQKSVAVVVAMLEERGPTLPFPYSSGITGSTKLRELRVQHAGKHVPAAGTKPMSRERRSCLQPT
jgi:hypothetical protein